MATVAGPLPVAGVLSDMLALTLQRHCQEELFAPYCGRWIKDKEASQSMAHVCGALGFSTLMQQAVKLIKGLEIGLHSGTISVSVFSIISWFKLSERYPVDGSEVKNSRRDMRTGGMMTRLTGGGGRVCVHMRWGGAYAGEALDVLSMPDPNTLHLVTTIRVNGASPASALQVYRRVA